MSGLDLNYIMHEKVGFAHSKKDRTSLMSVVKCNSFFYCMWRETGKSVDFVTFNNPADYNSVKFFRYSEAEVMTGIDLDSEKPSFEGKEAVDFILQAYKN